MNQQQANIELLARQLYEIFVGEERWIARIQSLDEVNSFDDLDGGYQSALRDIAEKAVKEMNRGKAV